MKTIEQMLEQDLVPMTQRELDAWVANLPKPRMTDAQLAEVARKLKAAGDAHMKHSQELRDYWRKKRRN